MGTEFSRRSFLALGAGAVGMLVVAPSLAPGPAGAATQDGGRAVGSTSFPYTLAAWQGLQGSSVRMERSGGRSTALRVRSVTDLAGSDGEVFSVGFSGAAPAAGEGTYVLSHPSLGRFPMFLTEGGSGTLSALVNRSHG